VTAEATTVRLVGVDTPETVHPRMPVERFGREVTQFPEGLVGGKFVRVEYEPRGSRLDRYGRALADLCLEPGGLFVNREIIAKGYGRAYTKDLFRFLADLRTAERSAREKQLGPWAPETGSGMTEPIDSMVYVTRTGPKYHRAGCRTLARSSSATPIPLDRAVARVFPVLGVQAAHRVSPLSLRSRWSQCPPNRPRARQGDRRADLDNFPAPVPGGHPCAGILAAAFARGRKGRNPHNARLVIPTVDGQPGLAVFFSEKGLSCVPPF
jgi:hypothetical protein